MKYIRNFDNLNSAKAATLYSPTLAEIKQDGKSVLLAKDLGSKDAEMQINVDASGNISVEEKPTTIALTLNVIGGYYIDFYKNNKRITDVWGETPQQFIVNINDTINLICQPTMRYVFNGFWENNETLLSRESSWDYTFTATRNINITLRTQHLACCFAPGTQVLLSDNTAKNIENIVAGDHVLSYNMTLGQIFEAKVNKLIIKNDTTTMAKVTLENDIEVTMNEYHPLLTVDGWHSITNYNEYPTLAENDTLITKDGNVKIKSIERWIEETPIVTYNLDVVNLDDTENENDNFFANGIVAHNDC